MSAMGRKADVEGEKLTAMHAGQCRDDLHDPCLSIAI